VRASNQFGWGDFSDAVTIRADEVPAQISPVKSIVEQINVRLSWSLPSTDNGAKIEEYRVFVRARDGSMQQSCDGKDLELIASTEPSCTLLISELREQPFSLR